MLPSRCFLARGLDLGWHHNQEVRKRADDMSPITRHFETNVSVEVMRRLDESTDPSDDIERFLSLIIMSRRIVGRF